MLPDRIHWFVRLLVALILSSTILVVEAQEVRLDPGDIVRISVYGHKDLEAEVRISNDGDINFPLVGNVSLAGLTTHEAEAQLAKMLTAGNFVSNAQVNVFVVQRRLSEGDSATILGEVARPGRFAVDAMTEGAANSIVGLLALAGGTTDKAADYLLLTRETNGAAETVRIDLIELLAFGNIKENQKLERGDIVFVPRMDVFYVYGEVARPGSYRLERNMTVMQAIAVAGGLSPRASERGISVKRRNADKGIQSFSIKLTQSLEPDDVLYVNEGLF